MSEDIYAGVIIDQAHPALDKKFHYIIPHALANKVQVGMRVLIPFGAGNRTIEGYVMSIDRSIDVPRNKLKSIKKVLDPHPIILPQFIPLILWMKKEYHCLTIEAIRCFIPPGLRRNIGEKMEKVVYLTIEKDIKGKIESVEKRSRYMGEILRILNQEDGIALAELADRAGGAPLSSFKNLEKRRWISIEDEGVYRNPWDQPIVSDKNQVLLTEDQKKVIDTINVGIAKSRGVFLLHGVTGSGKTEVYMQLVEQVIMDKEQAIILVPEISLTPQTVGRFKSRFGEEVAVLHSRLSLGERYDEWRRIYNNEVKIVVGARSAIFAPIRKLGIVIIDEAHEDSYKSGASPRYHTVGLASQRCDNEKAVLVLGTATPSLEDYYKSTKKEYTRVNMDYRVENRPLPQVEVVDMRIELEKGNRSIFSQPLYDGIQRIMSKNEQAIILLNRRGYAQFVSCRSCGYVVKCNNCDISLTYHSRNNILKCHYCGYNSKYPSICPECKSPYIKHFGIGTQRVEDEIKNFFPEARIIRMDMDTTSRKGSHQKILDAFRAKEYDILLGTQMVAKGLDFPDVTLVGVIAADTSLNLPDYRSSEKTFQLITQVAGRAGRGDREGNVIVQTYQPEHYSIQHASRHNYKGFYDEEIKIRSQFKYPPFCHIVRILITGEDEKPVINTALKIKDWIQHRLTKDPILKSGVIELGAYPAPLERVKNKYRWHVLTRIEKDRIFVERYHEAVDQCVNEFSNTPSTIVTPNTIVVDFFPISLL
ncbi:MAG TPA: primosomal protein N' [Clostridia bacterium]|nr:primosomal protein N' [Clostridia bacterium]